MVASFTPAKIDWSNINNPEVVLQRFPSRRSVIYGTKGVVSSSQPLATAAGLEILRQGGNAGTDRSASHNRRSIAGSGVPTQGINLQPMQLSLPPRH